MDFIRRPFATEPIPAGCDGVIAVLSFTVNCPGCTEGQTGALTFTSLEDDIAAFASVDGEFTYTCGLATPTPTNTPVPDYGVPMFRNPDSEIYLFRFEFKSTKYWAIDTDISVENQTEKLYYVINAGSTPHTGTYTVGDGSPPGAEVREP